MANKKYSDFTPGTYDTSKIFLQADATTGALESINLPTIPAIVTPDMAILQAMGSQIKAQSTQLLLTQCTGGLVLNDQQVRYVAMWIPAAATLTGLLYYQAQQGNYTANNFNGADICTYAGGTLTQVATTGNQANIWKASANAWHQQAFSATYNSPGGLLIARILYCRSAQVTAPNILGSPSMFNNAMVNYDCTNSGHIGGIHNTQTSLVTPQAMSGMFPFNVIPFIALY